MRIVLVNTFFPSHRGGLEIVAGRLAMELARLGAEIEWFAGDATPPPVPVAGITTRPVHCWNWTENRLGIPWPIWTPLASLKLLRSIAHADVVHIHDCLYASSMMAFVAAKVCRKPVVFTQHIDVIPYRSKLLSALMRLATGIASHMLTWSAQTVFIGSKTLEYFRSRKKFHRSPVLIPNGVDSVHFSPRIQQERARIRRNLGIKEDAAVNLFVGRFVEKKGLNLLRELVHGTPDMSWIFLGWGPLDPRLWGERNVICPGAVSQEDTADYYRAADLLVLPSVGEGFPLVVQEAMSCGTPCLVTHDTAAGLEQPPDCLLRSSLTTLAFGEAVKSFHKNVRKKLELRTEVAEFAKKQWDWTSVGIAYLEVFRRVSSIGSASENTRQQHSPEAKAS